MTSNGEVTTLRAEELCGRLPVVVTQGLLDDNPGLARVLTRLSDVMTSSGVVRGVSGGVNDEGDVSRTQARRDLIKQKLLLRAAKDVIGGGHSEPGSILPAKALAERLTAAHTAQHINLRTVVSDGGSALENSEPNINKKGRAAAAAAKAGSPNTLYGISAASLVGKGQVDADAAALLRQAVSDRLRDLHAKVASGWWACLPPSVASGGGLGDSVRAAAVMVRGAKHKMRSLAASGETLRQETDRINRRSLAVMEELASLQAGPVISRALADANFADLHSQALEARDRDMRARLLEATYDDATSAALLKIKALQERKLEQLGSLKKQLGQKLEDSRRLGPEFEELADRYAELMDKIENDEWTLLQCTERAQNAEPAPVPPSG